MNLKERLQHGWNAFMGRDPTPSFVTQSYDGGPERYRFIRGGERSMITAILNRIAVDVASNTIEHARLDEEDRYKGPMKSKFNECLTLAANTDQSGRAFIQDAAFSLLDEGVVAIVPTEATADPRITASYDIGKLRVAKVTHWYPQHVIVSIYNEYTGKREEKLYPKSMVALPENPFYAIMNEPNSLYQRLVSKLRMLDVIDQQSSSGKLDLIIQVPYGTGSLARKERAKERRNEIEQQLTGSKYGIAYIDGQEKVIQLNRAIENNLFTQIEYYTNMLFSQLGMPATVFNGTADAATMLNYQSRTIEPIISAITDSMRWKFLTPTARTQGQSVVFFRDPFKLTPVEQIAEIADKFTRNEILSSNEVRQIIGYRPSEDPSADELRNSNMPQKDEEKPADTPAEEDENSKIDVRNKDKT